MGAMRYQFIAAGGTATLKEAFCSFSVLLPTSVASVSVLPLIVTCKVIFVDGKFTKVA
jgi:hypothetical protein